MQAYSLRQVSKMLGVAMSTLYLRIKEGTAPRVTKIGARSVIFERDYRSEERREGKEC